MALFRELGLVAIEYTFPVGFIVFLFKRVNLIPLQKEPYDNHGFPSLSMTRSPSIALKLSELVERTTKPSSLHWPEVILFVDKSPISDVFDLNVETE